MSDEKLWQEKSFTSAEFTSTESIVLLSDFNAQVVTEKTWKGVTGRQGDSDINSLRDNDTYVYHDCDCNITKALL